LLYVSWVPERKSKCVAMCCIDTWRIVAYTHADTKVSTHSSLSSSASGELFKVDISWKPYRKLCLREFRHLICMCSFHQLYGDEAFLLDKDKKTCFLMEKKSKHVHQQLETNISMSLHRQLLANQLHGTESYFWKLIDSSSATWENFRTFYGNRWQQHATFFHIRNQINPVHAIPWQA
jgi:hypothetical protein